MEKCKAGLIVGGAAVLLFTGTALIVRSATGRKGLQLRTLLTVATLTLIAMAYGAVREEMAPQTTTGLLGRTVQIKGVVTMVYPGPTGTTVYLHVTDVGINSVNRKTNLRARWRERLSSPALEAGDKVLIRGVLGDPMPMTGIASKMPFQAPTYTLSGALQAMATAAQTEQTGLAGNLVRFRERWLRIASISGHVSMEHQQLAASIVFGASDLPVDVKNAFLAAGLLHVLAASGANIVLLELVLEKTFFRIWKLARLPYWLWGYTSIGFIWAFAGMCQFQPSIVRAAIMATYRRVGFMVGRKASIRASLAVAAAIMTFIVPTSMLSPSSWLSFVATAAIAEMVFTKGQRKHQGAMPAWHWRSPFEGTWVRAFLKQKSRAVASSMLTTLQTTIMVEVWLVPLVLVLFGQLTPYSIISNVIGEPLIGLVLPTSILWLTVSSLSAWLPGLNWITASVSTLEDGLLSGIEFLVTNMSQLPGAIWTMTKPPVWWLVMYYLLLTILRRYLWNWVKIRKRHRVSF